MKILVSDPLAEEGLKILSKEADVDVRTELSPEELVDCIGNYDALVVRSGTKVTAEVIEAGKNLKVVGRAGVGVDNVDVEKATERGIIVLNAPEGNTISAAEHTMAMMASLARNIPQANFSLKKGEWKRKTFVGVELYKKVLGIIGLGRIGGEVAKRARSFGMRILAYDPYIPAERAEKIGVSMTDLNTIFREADFITLHTPINPATRRLIGKEELGIMKDGVRIINCARGGLVDEDALYEALVSGKVAGAALDVFTEEPPPQIPLFELDNVIVTPHLGASTREAQVNVAVHVAEQVINALRGEPIISAVNVALVPPETMAEVKPFLPLMRALGSFYMQAFGGKVEEVELIYQGEIANYPVTSLTTAALIGLLSGLINDYVNYVNAPIIAKQRGIKVKEVTSKTADNFTNLITLNVKTERDAHTVAGTLFNRNDIRIVRIGGYRIDVTPSEYMLVSTYIDKPGVIGRMGTALGNAGINIAGMQVGRKEIGGEAVMVMQVDDFISGELLSQLEKLEGILSARFVHLDSEKR